jgi:Ca2+:H+ antiporter
MVLVMTIAVGSSIQIALLTAPVLVLAVYALGTPMDLVFSNRWSSSRSRRWRSWSTPITQDGETTWLEGVLLLAVYAVLGLAFFCGR